MRVGQRVSEGELLRQADVLVERGQDEDALRLLERTLRTDADAIEVRVRTAELHATRGEGANAVHHYTAAAGAYLERGSRVRAIALYEAALRIREIHSMRFEVAELYRDVGNVAMSRASYQRLAMNLDRVEGADRFIEAVRRRTTLENDHRLKPMIAELLWALGRNDEAAKVLGEIDPGGLWPEYTKRKHELFPEDDGMARRVARHFLESGAVERAVEILGGLKDPGAEDLLSLADALTRCGRRDGAVQALVRAARAYRDGGAAGAAHVTARRAASMGEVPADLAALLVEPRTPAVPPAPTRVDGPRAQEVEAPRAPIHGPGDEEADDALRSVLQRHDGIEEKRVRAARQAASAGTTYSSTRLLDRFVESQMPQPIAAAWRAAGRAEGPEAVFRSLHECGHVVLRVLLGIAISDYARGATAIADARRAVHMQLVGGPDRTSSRLGEREWFKLEAPDEEATRLLAGFRSLRMDSVGIYRDLLRDLARYLGRRTTPAPFVPELAAWLFRADGSPTEHHAALDALVVARNDDVHLRDGARATADAMLDRMRAVLDSLRWLARYRLLRIVKSRGARGGERNGKLQVFSGHEEDPQPIHAAWKGDLVDGAMYLVDPNVENALEVSPFLEWRAGEAEGEPERLFVWKNLDEVGRIRLWYGTSRRTGWLRFQTPYGEKVFYEWLADCPELHRSERFEEVSGHLEPLGSAAEIGKGPLMGRFELRGPLGGDRGGGGMSSVYLAFDRRDEREIALKLLNLEHVHQRHLVQRFEREIDTMRALRHPNIVRIEDWGELADGRRYIVLPVLRDGTLADIAGRSIELRSLLPWMRDALSALAHMHAEGVVHRDIKPANLFLQDRSVLVGDFGVARRVGTRTLTGTNERVGTQAYMSPEQVRGGPVEAPTDVYSLALVFDQLTVGASRPRAAPGLRIHGAWGELLRGMGKQEAEERPTAADALMGVEAQLAAQANEG